MQRIKNPPWSAFVYFGLLSAEAGTKNLLDFLVSFYPQNLYKNTFIYSKHEGFVGYVSVSMFEMNTVDIPQVQEINDGCFFSVRLINKLDENIK